MPSGEPLVLELATPDAPAVRLEWDVEALRKLGLPSPPGADQAQPAWRLDTEPDWERAGALRVISAGFEDGAILAVAALRPRETAGHDAEAVGAVLLSAEGDATQVHEALLSTEYGPNGKARRLGLELYEGPADPPIRVAADRLAEGREGPGGERTAFKLTMEGTPGTGLYELRPGPQRPTHPPPGTGR
jgi:hypothetical protein